MTPIAFLTLSDPTGFFIYDSLAQQPLADHGLSLHQIPWDTPDHDWSQYAMVVIRSTWDYINRLDEFYRALDHISQHTALHNSAQVVRWNADKHYLANLASAGVPSLPTRYEHNLTTARLAALFDELDTPELIIKPTISANAHHTFRLRRDADPHTAAHVIETHQHTTCLIQPFAPEILTQGEISLIFFDGQLSHTIRKTPRPGDFRVQEEHGGLLSTTTPDPDALTAAHAALEATPHGPLLYARVDLVRHQDRWALMELELIEPSLYLNLDPLSPQRLANAIARRIK